MKDLEFSKQEGITRTILEALPYFKDHRIKLVSTENPSEIIEILESIKINSQSSAFLKNLMTEFY